MSDEQIRTKALGYLSYLKRNGIGDDDCKCTKYTGGDIVGAYISGYKASHKTAIKWNSPSQPPTHSAEVLCMVLAPNCTLQVLRYDNHKWYKHVRENSDEQGRWIEHKEGVHAWREIIV